VPRRVVCDVTHAGDLARRRALRDVSHGTGTLPRTYARTPAQPRCRRFSLSDLASAFGGSSQVLMLVCVWTSSVGGDARPHCRASSARLPPVFHAVCRRLAATLAATLRQ
jgi:hypothetical protein